MLRRTTLPIAIALLTSTGLLAQNPGTASGERRLVRMLGLEAQYDKLFAHSETSDGMIVVGATGVATDPSTGETKMTRQWDRTTQYVVGYSWLPQNASVKQLTKKKIIEGCGKPDKITTDLSQDAFLKAWQNPKTLTEAVTYGRVSVAFGATGQVSQVAIDYDK